MSLNSALVFESTTHSCSESASLSSLILSDYIQMVGVMGLDFLISHTFDSLLMQVTGYLLMSRERSLVGKLIDLTLVLFLKLQMERQRYA